MTMKTIRPRNKPLRDVDDTRWKTKGGPMRVKEPRAEICPTCDGHSFDDCGTCGGDGFIYK